MKQVYILLGERQQCPELQQQGQEFILVLLRKRSKERSAWVNCVKLHM
jgi:hypothetical protein